MKLPIITLTHEEPEQEVAALAGQSIGAGHYDRSVDPFTIYLKPNGQFLCLWLKKVITPSLQRDALRVLKHKEIAPPGSAANRGIASGKGADPKAGSSILGSFDREGRHHPCAAKAGGIRASSSNSCRMSKRLIGFTSSTCQTSTTRNIWLPSQRGQSGSLGTASSRPFRSTKVSVRRFIRTGTICLAALLR